MPWAYSYHLNYYPRWDVQTVYIPPPPPPPLPWFPDYLWGNNGLGALPAQGVNMWVPPAVAPVGPPAGQMFPAQNVASTLATTAWPVNPIPGRTFLVLLKLMAAQPSILTF